MSPSHPRYTRNDLQKIAETKLDLEQLLEKHELWTADRKVDRTIGHTSSWAVWPSPATIGAQRSADWISRGGADDVLDLKDDEVLDQLHPDCVFLALNKGKPEMDDKDANWGCFHVSAQDAKLPKALWPGGEGEPLAPFWGGYMTDLFKGLPTASGDGLKDMLRTSPTGRRYAHGTDATFQIRHDVIAPLPTKAQVESADEKKRQHEPRKGDLRGPITQETKDAIYDAMAAILAQELELIGADREKVGFVLLGDDVEKLAPKLFSRGPLTRRKAPCKPSWQDAFEARHTEKVPHYSSSVRLTPKPGEKTYREHFVAAAETLRS